MAQPLHWMKMFLVHHIWDGYKHAFETIIVINYHNWIKLQKIEYLLPIFICLNQLSEDLHEEIFFTITMELAIVYFRQWKLLDYLCCFISKNVVSFYKFWCQSIDYSVTEWKIVVVIQSIFRKIAVVDNTVSEANHMMITLPRAKNNVLLWYS